MSVTLEDLLRGSLMVTDHEGPELLLLLSSMCVIAPQNLLTKKTQEIWQMGAIFIVPCHHVYLCLMCFPAITTE